MGGQPTSERTLDLKNTFTFKLVLDLTYVTHATCRPTTAQNEGTMKSHKTMFASVLASSIMAAFNCQAQVTTAQSPQSDGFLHGLKNIFSAPKEDGLEKLRASVRDLSDEDLIRAYGEALRTYPGQIQPVTALFVTQNSKLTDRYIVQLLALDPKPTATLPEDIRNAAVDALTNPEERNAVGLYRFDCQGDRCSKTPEERAAVASKLIKKYPDHAIGLLLFVYSEYQVDASMLSTATAPAFASVFEGGLPKIAIVGAVVAGLALASSSSSSSTSSCGGGSCTELNSPDVYKTTEYNTQAGLALVNAANLYAYGGTGSGIKVAVLDSGILASHSKFSDRISSGGYDYVTSTDGVTTDGNGHGTHVSGIIAAKKDGTGMHGVAYEATIVPFKITNSSGAVITTDAQTADAFSLATASGARILNNSWGSSTAITAISKASLDASIPLALAQAQTSVNAGAVFVWAASNDGRAQPSYQAGLPYYYPDLKAGWLAVMAVDLTGAEPAYSNRCGVAATWCLAAPGGSDTESTGGVYSTYNDGSYKRLSGTSMAAPHVSGALAALKSRFPNLSYHQIRDRLLTTANRTGAYADSTIYGQGLMDLNGAASPVGVTMLTTSSHATGTATSTSSSLLTLPASLYSVFKNQLDNASVMVVDSYQRAPFYVSAKSFVQSQPVSFEINFKNVFSKVDPKHVNGVTSYFDPTNATVSFEGVNNVGSSKMRWFVGNSPSGKLHNALDLVQGLPVDERKKLAGASLQWGESDQSSFRAGVWIPTLSGDADSPVKVPMQIRESQTLAPINSGIGIRKGWTMSSDTWASVGLSYGKPEEVSRGFSGRGAFESEATNIWAFSLSAGTEKKSQVGQFTLNSTVNHIQLSSKEQASLIDMRNTIRLADIGLKVGYESLNRKTRVGLSAGHTMVLGNPQITLSLPTAVNEAGEVTYQRLSAAAGKLYDHSWISLSINQKLSQNFEIVTIVSGLGPTPTSVLRNRFMGAAGKWSF